MSKLFSKFKVGNIEIKNRIVMPPMCMYIAETSGIATDFHLTHYVTRAVGGVGFIILEATAVEPCGRISANDLGLWSDEHIYGLKKIVEQVKSYGATVGIQINHAGRKCGVKTEDKIYAPSAIAFSKDYLTPQEMTVEKIESTVQLFKDAARRAGEAGFDFIEIHAAHGYLLSEFLSPLANKRNDQYGGNHENRVRFLGEVLKASKEVFKGAIGVRVSASDHTEGGNKPEDLVKMINIIKSLGIDIVDVSSGAVTEVVPTIFPGYQVKFAEEIKQGCELPVIAGGLLTNADMMEEIVSNNRADMVFVGRELLRNPYFSLKAAHDLKEEIKWVKSYERAKFR